MTTKIVAIDQVGHRGLKVKHDASFSKAKHQHFSLLHVSEFVTASHYFPIVFIKDTETGELRPVAMFGLQEKENLFYDPAGWPVFYVPHLLRAHPFALTPEPGNEEMLLMCIDLNSANISDDGEAIFDAEGNDTPYFTQVKEFMWHLYSQIPVTEEFTKELVKKNLLRPSSFSVNKERDGQEPYTVSGIYAVDPKALHELPDADFLELKNKGYLPPIFAHMSSLHLVSILAQKKAKLAAAK